MTRMIPPLNTSLSSENARQEHVSDEVMLSEIAAELAQIGESTLSVEEVAIFRAKGWSQHESVRHIRSILGLSTQASDPSMMDSTHTIEKSRRFQRKRVLWQVLSRIEAKDAKSQTGQRVGDNRIWPFASIFAVAASLICVWMIEGRSDSGLHDIGRDAHDMLQSLPSLDEHSGLVAGQLQGPEPDRWAQFVARTMLDGEKN